MDKYHYTECGLDYVWLLNGFVVKEVDGEMYYSVKDRKGLHRAIGEDILNKTSLLTGDEIRFLRKEVGLSQNELANVIGVEDQTIANWEKGKTSHDKAEDIVIRMLYAEEIGVDKHLQDYLTRLARDEMEVLERSFHENEEGSWEPEPLAA